MYKLILVFFALTFVSVDAQAQEALTADDVLAMIAEVPVQLGHWRRAGFDKKPDAPVIAAAIAATADGSLLGTVREDAALMVVYAAYEGGMRKCPAAGDGGKSWGVFQMQRSPWKIACTPALAAAEWLQRAQYSMQTCSSLPLEEQLASLASGSCGHGRQLVRRRVEVARRVALLAQGMGE